MTPQEKIKLKKLTKELSGHLSAIAGELGVSKSTVTRVLKGDWVNNVVLNKCIEYRDRLQEKQNEILSKI